MANSLFFFVWMAISAVMLHGLELEDADVRKAKNLARTHSFRTKPPTHKTV